MVSWIPDVVLRHVSRIIIKMKLTLVICSLIICHVNLVIKYHLILIHCSTFQYFLYKFWKANIWLCSPCWKNQKTILTTTGKFFFFLYIFRVFCEYWVPLPPSRAQHTVLCHPSWLPTSGLTELAMCWGGAGFWTQNYWFAVRCATIEPPLLQQQGNSSPKTNKYQPGTHYKSNSIFGT